MTTTTSSVSDLVRDTPTTRDRYVDFLRLASIVVVVLGHLLMAVVTWHGSEFRVGNVIEITPGLWLATWLFQVMPIFFFVGGFSNFVTLESRERQGQGAAEFLVGRVDRLLRPVALLLAVWLVAASALLLAGMDRRLLGAATRLVCQPLWFIGVYLGVTALAPGLRRLHNRHALPAVGALFVVAVAVDALRFGLHVDAIGYLNLLFVWLFAQQLGFFYADGTLTRVRRSHLAASALGALVVLFVATTWGPYPRSMVGLPGDRISNMSPPTLCLAVLTVFQVAVVMMLRSRAQRQLSRPLVWTAVVAGNGVIMTIFLWHLSAALVALGFLHALGAPQPAASSSAWWISRPVWIVCALVPLAALIALFGRYERPRLARYYGRGPRSPLAAGVGVALLCIAVLGIANTDFVRLVANSPIDLALVTVSPLQLLALTVVGITLVRRAGTTRVGDEPVRVRP